MRTILAALLISGFAIPTRAFGQDRSPADGRDERTRRPSLRLSTAQVVEAENRGRLRPAVLPLSVQQQPPQRSWPGRHPVLFGALVGLGVGLAVEAAVIPGARGGEPHRVYIPMFAAFGAGIGSATGLVISLVRR